ncbi:MAG: UDP-2,3-diacylglucosamine diphosphatase LpxI [Rhodobiaceae bacterium]|nr:UDP-2,3-diacylglucosamine diphosphatase LpxI [Rhodobiaceae bacterium]
MSSAHVHSGGRIALVAGEGEMPCHLVRAGRAGGVDLVVYGIKGLCSDSLEADHVFGLGELGRIKRQLAADGVERIAFSGRFYRPDYGAIEWDSGAVAVLPAILKTRLGGDDSALRTIRGVAASWGLDVAGPPDIAPELVAPAGPLSTKRPGRAQMRDIETGMQAIAGLGKYDIGQALVVHDQRIVAVEAAEGTDQMIARIAILREQGRLRAKPPSGVLVKAAKPDQELYIDMPVVGADTVRAAAKAGLAGIAFGAGEVLVATPEDVRAEAGRLGLFVIGVKPGAA